MYGGWGEYVVLWTNILEFIWDIKNVPTTYIYRVWAQSPPSKSWTINYQITTIKSEQNSTVNKLVV